MTDRDRIVREVRALFTRYCWSETACGMDIKDCTCLKMADNAVSLCFTEAARVVERETERDRVLRRIQNGLEQVPPCKIASRLTAIAKGEK